MKKTLVTTVLGCAMAFLSFAASAQNQTQQAVKMSGDVFSSNVAKSLSILAVSPSEGIDLVSDLSARAPENKVLGFKRSNGGFVSLADAIADVKTVQAADSARVSVIPLGTFSENESFQLGYGSSEDGGDFTPFSISQAKSTEPNYYAGYNPDSFYQLDFAEDPFNGMIEIYVMGEPLPASTVTLIVALAAGALFLLYKNRGQRRSLQTEQA
jgi:hypothetical protein